MNQPLTDIKAVNLRLNLKELLALTTPGYIYLDPST